MNTKQRMVFAISAVPSPILFLVFEYVMTCLRNLKLLGDGSTGLIEMQSKTFLNAINLLKWNSGPSQLSPEFWQSL